MIAAGTIRVLALYLETYTVYGLPFTPRRILFRTAITSPFSAADISFGLWSADRPDSGDLPAQSAQALLIVGGDAFTYANRDLIARINRKTDPEQNLHVKFNVAADNAFTIEAILNTLNVDAYIHWVATP